MALIEPDSPLHRFRASLQGSDGIARLRDGLIGDGLPIDGPFGRQSLLYADYVASGRALRQVERFMLEEVLPYYANSHTEASFCGEFITRLRHDARTVIADAIGATGDYSVIFAGAGATAGLNRLVPLFGIRDALARGEQVVVLHGPYEHHSNILPWRESGAEVVEIREGRTGGPDLEMLEHELRRTAGYALCIGAFSALSNVTGIVTDTDAVTAVLKRHGALAVWDYAGGGPYLEVEMAPTPETAKDAVVFSTHKFPGGPGGSGVLVVRTAAVRATRPTSPGGGTMRFVAPWFHDYLDDLVSREEAGTPNVLGDIRAALAFIVKQAVGQAFIDARHEELNRRALAVWQDNPNLMLFGIEPDKRRVPIFSFKVRDPAGNGLIHHQLFTRMLSDLYGIQARGGCVCAGPYGISLMGIDRPTAEALRDTVNAGHELAKPGWVRLNFSYLLSDEKADRIIAAVDELARNPYPMANRYRGDDATAHFSPIAA